MNEKEIFIELCKKYKCENIITDLEVIGFFEAPASSRFHLNHIGGLLKHSLNVFKLMLKLKLIYNAKVTDKDIFYCAFFHDLDKCFKYKPYIINNVTIYKYNDTLGLPNGYGSIYILNNIFSSKLNINKDVANAIINHMGFWDNPNFKEVMNNLKNFPYIIDLLTLLRHSDEGATFCIERNKDFEGN